MTSADHIAKAEEYIERIETNAHGERLLRGQLLDLARVHIAIAVAIQGEPDVMEMDERARGIPTLPDVPMGEEQ